MELNWYLLSKLSITLEFNLRQLTSQIETTGWVSVPANSVTRLGAPNATKIRKKKKCGKTNGNFFF